MTVDDPLLPQTLDDESALFGCILMNPQAIRFANDLTPADFSNDARQTLFAVMRQLDADGLPCNLLTLITRLERTGQLERVGGASTLSRMIKVMPTPENTLRYIRLVKQAAQDRQTALLADALDSIASERPDPPQTTAYTSEPRRADGVARGGVRWCRQWFGAGRGAQRRWSRARRRGGPSGGPVPLV